MYFFVNIIGNDNTNDKLNTKTVSNNINLIILIDFNNVPKNLLAIKLLLQLQL